MWAPADRTLIGYFGSGQALTDDQFRLLEPLIRKRSVKLSITHI
jgi:putative transposase